MRANLPQVQIKVHSCTFIKDPESSDLGKRIISGSINLLDEMGFEKFTFRKLADFIHSTEASVYRYFESKHKLLLYLTTWYWAWMKYRLMFEIANVDSAEDRLERTIKLLTSEINQDGNFEHIDEIKLNRIVIADSFKSYFTKNVDKENQQGAFSTYKELVGSVSDIVLEINPSYKYPHMLVSTAIEGAHQQRFFKEHLPKLTDRVKGEDAITNFYTSMVMKSAKSNS